MILQQTVISWLLIYLNIIFTVCYQHIQTEWAETDDWSTDCQQSHLSHHSDNWPQTLNVWCLTAADCIIKCFCMFHSTTTKLKPWLSVQMLCILTALMIIWLTEYEKLSFHFMNLHTLIIHIFWVFIFHYLKLKMWYHFTAEQETQLFINKCNWQLTFNQMQSVIFITHQDLFWQIKSQEQFHVWRWVIHMTEISMKKQLQLQMYAFLKLCVSHIIINKSHWMKELKIQFIKICIIFSTVFLTWN